MPEVWASASGVALEEVSFTSPVHTAGNATKRKGEPLVDLLSFTRETRSAGEESAIPVITREYVPFIQIFASSHVTRRSSPTFVMVHHGRKHEERSFALQVPMCFGGGW